MIQITCRIMKHPMLLATCFSHGYSINHCINLTLDKDVINLLIKPLIIMSLCPQ